MCIIKEILFLKSFNSIFKLEILVWTQLFSFQKYTYTHGVGLEVRTTQQQWTPPATRLWSLKTIPHQKEPRLLWCVTDYRSEPEKVQDEPETSTWAQKGKECSKANGVILKGHKSHVNSPYWPKVEQFGHQKQWLLSIEKYWIFF